MLICTLHLVVTGWIIFLNNINNLFCFVMVWTCLMCLNFVEASLLRLSLGTLNPPVLVYCCCAIILIIIFYSSNKIIVWWSLIKTICVKYLAKPFIALWCWGFLVFMLIHLHSTFNPKVPLNTNMHILLMWKDYITLCSVLPSIPGLLIRLWK